MGPACWAKTWRQCDLQSAGAYQNAKLSVGNNLKEITAEAVFYRRPFVGTPEGTAYVHE